MKKINILFVIFSFFIPAVNATDIQYGYNAQGDYVPMSVGNNTINYGYNAQGDYVPMSIGNKHINYGYNSQGDYVPVSYDDFDDNDSDLNNDLDFDF